MELKPVYDFTCAACGHPMRFRPSLAMTFGQREAGHGTCSKCHTFLRLSITDENLGASETWADFMTREGVKDEGSEHELN